MTNESLLDSNVLEGIRLFNAGKYFEAHEALESAWRSERDSIRNLYQGILQVAVCYLHITRHNYSGAIKMYERSQKWLAPWPEVTLGIHVAQLKKDLDNAIGEIRILGESGIDLFDRSKLKPILIDKAALGGSLSSTSKLGNLICDRCGHEMIAGNCKITCPNCGNRFDCSDLNVHFDEW
jgi:uncharacterized protein